MSVDMNTNRASEPKELRKTNDELLKTHSMKIMNLIYDIKDNISDREYKDLCEEVSHLSKLSDTKMSEAFTELSKLCERQKTIFEEIFWCETSCDSHEELANRKQHINRHFAPDVIDEINFGFNEVQRNTCPSCKHRRQGFQIGVLAAIRLFKAFLSVEDVDVCDHVVLSPEQQRESALRRFPLLPDGVCTNNEDDDDDDDEDEDDEDEDELDDEAMYRL